MSRKSWLFAPVMAAAALIAAPVLPAPAWAQGVDSCQWANDGECDEPGIGTGACEAGTDATDCTGVGLNTCEWANDGECDEPNIGTGVCAAGTDTGDCRPAGGVGPVGGKGGGPGVGDNSCQWANDGECDDPGIGTGACPVGTDQNDCAGVGLNTCQWAGDGECDEPGIGTGVCTAGTDTTDCRPAAGGAVGGGVQQAAACPATFQQVSGGSISCSCGPQQMTGTAWGTMTYTDDSSICAAAVHAGAIPASGGTVTAQAAAGCNSYPATTNNGIATSEWGSWGASFFFPSVSDGSCSGK